MAKQLVTAFHPKQHFPFNLCHPVSTSIIKKTRLRFRARCRFADHVIGLDWVCKQAMPSSIVTLEGLLSKLPGPKSLLVQLKSTMDRV